MRHHAPALAACILIAAAAPAPVLAQSGGRDKPADNALESNRYMRYDNPKSWTVRSSYYVYPAAGRVLEANEYLPSVAFDDFEIVAPFVASTGSAWQSSSEPVTVAIGFDSLPGEPRPPQVRRARGTEAPYAAVGYDREIAFSYLWLEVNSQLTSAETEFDEQAAWELPWPDEWPADVTAWLKRDPLFDIENDRPGDEVRALVESWTNHADPHSLPPVQLAKYLTGKVLEHVRTNKPLVIEPVSAPVRVVTAGSEPGLSGKQTILSTSSSGLSTAFGGFNVHNASAVAFEGEGSEHDLSNLLTAVLRRVGLPARTVIGVNKYEDGADRVKSWVEFALVAPGVEGVIWVPIDIWELEGDGRTSRNYEQEWEHFGTSELLRNTAPIAFYFHPPADYRSWNAPALFGIRADSPLPDFAVQAVHFDINSTPNRAGPD